MNPQFNLEKQQVKVIYKRIQTIYLFQMIANILTRVYKTIIHLNLLIKNLNKIIKLFKLKMKLIMNN